MIDLTDVDLSNAELSVERRVNLFLGNDRAHVLDRALFLTECRLRGVELLFGNNFSRGQIARPLEIRARQFQIGFGRLQMRFFG